jgi:hypothetical protein
MKQKTNGKIVIAILAMFAIAASIIGFTYAYFTANLTRNTQDRSTEVIAGKLMATFNGTNSIDVKNVVPGWKSDALHYYNASSDSVKDGTIEGVEITDVNNAYIKENKMTALIMDNDEFWSDAGTFESYKYVNNYLFNKDNK